MPVVAEEFFQQRVLRSESLYGKPVVERNSGGVERRLGLKSLERAEPQHAPVVLDGRKVAIERVAADSPACQVAARFLRHVARRSPPGSERQPKGLVRQPIDPCHAAPRSEASTRPRAAQVLRKDIQIAGRHARRQVEFEFDLLPQFQEPGPGEPLRLRAKRGGEPPLAESKPARRVRSQPTPEQRKQPVQSAAVEVMGFTLLFRGAVWCPSFGASGRACGKISWR